MAPPSPTSSIHSFLHSDPYPSSPPRPSIPSSNTAQQHGSPSQPFSQSHSSQPQSPTQLLTHLESLLTSKASEIQLAGRLGEALLAQQAELEMKIREVEMVQRAFAEPSSSSPLGDHEQEGGLEEEDVGEETRRKLRALEDQMRDWDEGNRGLFESVGRAAVEPSPILQAKKDHEPSSASMGMGRSTSSGAGGMGMVRKPSSTASLRRQSSASAHPPQLGTAFTVPPVASLNPLSQSLAPSSSVSNPTNTLPKSTSASADRRARNSHAAHTAQDLELSVDIAQSLVQELRRLQSLLEESREELRREREEKVALSEEGERERERRRGVEENVEKFKEENWNLELLTQDLRSQLADLSTQAQKSDLSHQRALKDLSNTRETIDSQKLDNERLVQELEKVKMKFEVEMAGMRKSQAGLQRERSDLQGVMEGLKNQLETAKRGVRKVSRNATGDNLAGILSGDEEGEEAEEGGEDVFGAMVGSNGNLAGRRKTGDGFLPPPSPSDSFDSPGGVGDSPVQRGGGGVEALSHARRQIETLKKALKREKELRISGTTAGIIGKGGKEYDEDDELDGLDSDEERWRDEQEEGERMSTPARRGRGARGGRGGRGGRRGGTSRKGPSRLGKEMVGDLSIEEGDEDFEDSPHDSIHVDGPSFLDSPAAQGSIFEHHFPATGDDSFEGNSFDNHSIDHEVASDTASAEMDPAFAILPSAGTGGDRDLAGSPLGHSLSRKTGHARPDSISSILQVVGVGSGSSGRPASILSTQETPATKGVIHDGKEVGVMTDFKIEPTIVIKEVPVEVIKEVPVEVIKEVVREVQVEKRVEVPVPFEVIKEVIKEVRVEVEKRVEVPVEVIKEVKVPFEVEKRVEVPVEVVRIEERIKEVPVEVIKEVPVPVEVVREVIKEVPVEVTKDVPVEVVKEVQVIKEVPVEVIKEVIKEIPVEVIKEVIKEVPVEVIKEIIKEVPVEVIKEVEVIREVIKEVPVEVIREVIKTVEVPVEVIKEVFKEVEVIKEVEVPKEVIREVIREVEVPKEVVREVIKEIYLPAPVPSDGAAKNVVASRMEDRALATQRSLDVLATPRLSETESTMTLAGLSGLRAPPVDSDAEEEDGNDTDRATETENETDGEFEDARESIGVVSPPPPSTTAGSTSIHDFHSIRSTSMRTLSASEAAEDDEDVEVLQSPFALGRSTATFKQGASVGPQALLWRQDQEKKIEVAEVGVQTDASWLPTLPAVATTSSAAFVPSHDPKRDSINTFGRPESGDHGSSGTGLGLAVSGLAAASAGAFAWAAGHSTLTPTSERATSPDEVFRPESVASNFSQITRDEPSSLADKGKAAATSQPPLSVATNIFTSNSSMPPPATTTRLAQQASTRPKASPRKSGASTNSNQSLRSSPPPRPTSPPPADLLYRAQSPAFDSEYDRRASGLLTPASARSPASISGSSHNMPPPARPSQSSLRVRPQASLNSDFNANALGPNSNTAGSKGKTTVRRHGGGASASAISLTDTIHSDVSRRMSVASSRTSEGGLDTSAPMPGISGSTDPSVIHSITQAMIGENMYKYKRRAIGKGYSDKRHKRYFWIHPYTNVLYWSSLDPQSSKTNSANSKSAFIQGVRQVIDPNPNPPGLSQNSIIVETPERELKITAVTRERHDMWLQAINYLLSRPGTSNATRTPATPGSMSFPRSGVDSDGEWDVSPNTSATTKGLYTHASQSDSRLTPKGGQEPRRKKLSTPSTYKRADTLAADFERSTMFGSPRSLRTFSDFLGGDESVEYVDRSEIPSDLGHDDDDGFEGLENVRACCSGKHDVGSLARRHHHHHHHHHHGSEASTGSLQDSPTRARSRSSLGTYGPSASSSSSRLGTFSSRRIPVPSPRKSLPAGAVTTPSTPLTPLANNGTLNRPSGGRQ
ncbi:hypothetical protein T439DRAFT_357881 [Meredithblackwellia eburnea MCA 4105]